MAGMRYGQANLSAERRVALMSMTLVERESMPWAGMPG